MKPTAQFFKALADESRLKMLWLLFHQKELCVCDFVATLQITQSKASRHLRTLFHEGFVTDRKDGLWSYYSLRQPKSEAMRLHMDLLSKTLANCPEATLLINRLDVWLKHDRTFPVV